ncbi:MAG: DUF5753 domain-containing protein, partial [Actinomycetes bacterium]
QLWFVLTEAVLRRQVGGRDAMREQLERMLEVSELSTVSLHVIPNMAGAHPAMGAAFSIVRLSEQGIAVVYLEDLLGAEYLNKPAQVNEYTQVFDRLCQAALDAEGTADMIKNVVGELR